MIYISLKGFVNVHILKQCTLTEAIVTRNLYTSMPTSHSRKSYRVEFKYIVNLKEYIIQEDLGDKTIKYNVGEKIQIYYNNDDANKAQIYRIAYMPLMFAIFLLPLITLTLIKSEKRDK